MNKGLVRLKELENNLCVFYLDNEEDEEQVKFITQSLCVIEKELKAFEIVKNKNVECWYLTQCEDLEEYNDYKLKKDGTYFTLTQEEFELLKEVLND